jgi:hypothetical protein
MFSLADAGRAIDRPAVKGIPTHTFTEVPIGGRA